MSMGLGTDRHPPKGRFLQPVTYFLPSDVVEASRDFTATPSNATSPGQKVRITEGTVGIVDEGLVKGATEAEPDKRWVAFEQENPVTKQTTTVCVSVPQSYLRKPA